ncbi:MAG: hypothetical protein ABSG51_07610 [Terracidiphilus sp.]|jgi:hypothetical protein
MNQHQLAPIFDGSFRHHWQAEILPARPLILPNRHYVYPRDAEEVERGALEVLVKLGAPGPGSPRTGLRPWGGDPSHLGTGESKSPSLPSSQSFLATCALGFRDPAVPTGLWSCPNPDEICALSGGYAYVISTTNPENFTMLPYRPVLEIRPVPAQNLLLFVGHHSVLAWGPSGQAWQSEKLSSEGITLEEIISPILHGMGWDLMTDKEIPFTLDLETGRRIVEFSR